MCKLQGSLRHCKKSSSTFEAERPARGKDLNDKIRVKSEDHYMSRVDTQWLL